MRSFGFLLDDSLGASVFPGSGASFSTLQVDSLNGFIVGTSGLLGATSIAATLPIYFQNGVIGYTSSVGSTTFIYGSISATSPIWFQSGAIGSSIGVTSPLFFSNNVFGYSSTVGTTNFIWSALSVTSPIYFTSGVIGVSGAFGSMAISSLTNPQFLYAGTSGFITGSSAHLFGTSPQYSIIGVSTSAGMRIVASGASTYSYIEFYRERSTGVSLGGAFIRMQSQNVTADALLEIGVQTSVQFTGGVSFQTILQYPSTLGNHVWQRGQGQQIDLLRTSSFSGSNDINIKQLNGNTAIVTYGVISVQGQSMTAGSEYGAMSFKTIQAGTSTTHMVLGASNIILQGLQINGALGVSTTAVIGSTLASTGSTSGALIVGGGIGSMDGIYATHFNAQRIFNTSIDSNKFSVTSGITTGAVQAIVGEVIPSNTTSSLATHVAVRAQPDLSSIGASLSVVNAFVTSLNNPPVNSLTLTHGFRIGMNRTSAGHVGAMFGFRMTEDSITGGSIGLVTALAIDTLTLGQTNYALAIGNNTSYHVGNVKIGASSAPFSTLDVGGTVIISGGLRVGNSGAVFGLVHVEEGFIFQGSGGTNPSADTVMGKYGFFSTDASTGARLEAGSMSMEYVNNWTGATASWDSRMKFDVINNGGVSTAIQINSNRDVIMYSTTASSGITTGALTIYGGLGVSGSINLGNRCSASDVSGTNRGFQINTSTGSSGYLGRWAMLGGSTAEGGTNSGTPFVLNALDDSGTYIDSVISVFRAAGGSFNISRPTYFGSSVRIIGSLGVSGSITNTGTFSSISAPGATIAQATIGQTSLLGTSLADFVFVMSRQSQAGTANRVANRDYLIRSVAGGTNWVTSTWHDCFSVDNSFTTPRTDTKAYYERTPNTGLHSFGNGATTFVSLLATGVTILPATTFGADTRGTKQTFFGGVYSLVGNIVASQYLQDQYGANMGSTWGHSMGKTGSIVDLSFITECDTYTSTGNFSVEVRKNGTFMIGATVSITGVGMFKAAGATLRGGITFIPSDVLSFYANFLSGNYEIKAVNAYTSVYFDT